MKMIKLAFWVKTEGGHGGDKPIFQVLGGMSPPVHPPLGETLQCLKAINQLLFTHFIHIHFWFVISLFKVVVGWGTRCYGIKEGES